MADRKKQLTGDEKRARTQLYEANRPGVKVDIRISAEAFQMLLDLHHTIGMPRNRIIEDLIREKYSKTPDLRKAPPHFYTTKPRKKQE